MRLHDIYDNFDYRKHDNNLCTYPAYAVNIISYMLQIHL